MEIGLDPNAQNAGPVTFIDVADIKKFTTRNNGIRRNSATRYQRCCQRIIDCKR